MSPDDVRRLALLARLRVGDGPGGDAEIAQLADELQGLLAHFAEIRAVDPAALGLQPAEPTEQDPHGRPPTAPLLGAPWTTRPEGLQDELPSGTEQVHPAPLRPDEPAPPLAREAVLGNAPDVREGQFRVPRVVGG